MGNLQTSKGRITKFKSMDPGMFNVILHNDDVTTFDFVIMILKRIFRKSEEDATALTMKVDREGSAVAGTYTYDIACSKMMTSMNLAKLNGFPLRLTVEEA